MCRVTVGHLRVTLGHLRLPVGYLKATLVLIIRVTLGHLKVTIGYSVTKQYFEILIFHNFCYYLPIGLLLSSLNTH